LKRVDSNLIFKFFVLINVLKNEKKMFEKKKKKLFMREYTNNLNTKYNLLCTSLC